MTYSRSLGSRALGALLALTLVATAGCGGGSEAASALPTVPTQAPTGLRLEPGVRSLRATWDALPSAQAYALYWVAYGAPTDGGDAPAWALVAGLTRPEATLTGLTDGVTYAVRVAVRNGAFEGPIGTQVTATVAPAAAVALWARPGNGRATVEWSAALGAQSYDLYVGPDPSVGSATWAGIGGARRLLDVTPPVQVEGLTNGVETWMRVVARNPAGASEDSPAGSVIPSPRGSFVPWGAVTAAPGPQGSVVADLRGDGVLDLIVACPDLGAVLTLEGLGDGTFADAVAHAVGPLPVGLIASDLNADGRPDLATVNQGDSSVSVLLANDLGGFEPAVSYPTGATPSSLVALELTAGSGVLDLVVANLGDDTLWLLTGFGDGTFAATQSLLSGDGPVHLVAGDFDGDGLGDVVTADAVSATLSWYAGDGLGGLAPAVPSSSVPGAIALRSAELNGDGVLDLIVVSEEVAVGLVMRGAGDGTFVSGGNVQGVGTAAGVGTGDFDGDGTPDLIVTNPADGSVSVLLGTGGGSYVLRETQPTGGHPQDVAVGDFNGDGILDLAVTDLTTGDVYILLGLGD